LVSGRITGVGSEKGACGVVSGQCQDFRCKEFVGGSDDANWFVRSHRRRAQQAATELDIVNVNGNLDIVDTAGIARSGGGP